MKRPSNFLLAEDRKDPAEKLSNIDCCVPDQALSIPELLKKCQRENKPLPVAVDYDIDSITREYDDLIVPECISREDALHLQDLTRAHMAKLDYVLRNKAKQAQPEQTPAPSTSDVGSAPSE